MNWKQKLSSRKLWACLFGVGVGIGVAFGLDAGAISQVAGSVTSLVSVVTYVIAEGKIDAAAVQQASIDIDTLTEQIREVLTEEKVGGSI